MVIKSKTLKLKSLAYTAIREIGAHLVALNVYPLGPILDFNEKAVPHPQRSLDHPAAAFVNARPVLLVHGIAHNSTAFIAVRRQMKLQGWQNIFSLNYKTRHGSLTGMVQQLSERVEEICAETQSDSIDIVAHSLGGIVSRYYMSLGEGRSRVKNLVTLGTPHRGTNLSIFLKGLQLGALDSDLKNGSYLIKLLTETSLPSGSTLTSIYAKHDWTVSPSGNCAADGLPHHAFHNIQIENTGHMGLLYSAEVAELAMNALLE